MSQLTYAIDALTRHQVYIHRYATSEVNKMLPFIDQMLRDVRSRMTMVSLTDFQMGRLAVLEQDLSIIVSQSVDKLSGQLSLDLTDFAEYETGFTQRFLDSMINVDSAGVTLDQISAALDNTPMTLLSGRTPVTLTPNQAMSVFTRSTSSTINRTIQSGIAQGQTTTEIVNEVSRVITHRTKAQAEALVRTLANHAGTVARDAVYQANSDIIESEEFVATLDIHTTDTCAGFDGQFFDLGQGPKPPLHYQCRSVRIPKIRDEFVIGDLKGDRGSVGADGAQPVSGKSTFGGWLRKQPASFQDEYFSKFADGEDRSKLFRNGGLSIDKFTDDKGATYTLDQLRTLEPQAFERANI